jgi:hypothetical protein
MRWSAHLRRVVASSVITLLGCGGPAEPTVDQPIPPRDDSPLQTEQLEYPFTYQNGTYGGTVVATYTNAGSSALYLDRCGRESEPVFFVVAAGVGLAPENVEGPISICTGVPPIALAPGESRTDRLYFLLHERRAGGAYTTVSQNAGRSGLYRLLYRPYASVAGSGDGAMGAEPLPSSSGLSNVFRIHFDLTGDPALGCWKSRGSDSVGFFVCNKKIKGV